MTTKRTFFSRHNQARATDHPTVERTLTASSAEATMPAANAQSEKLWEAWRSTAAGAQSLAFDTAQDAGGDVGFVGIFAHNRPAAISITFKQDDASQTAIATVALGDWPGSYFVVWDKDSETIVAQCAVSAAVAEVIPYHSMLLVVDSNGDPANLEGVGDVTIAFSGDSEEADGYYQVGHVIISEVYAPSRNTSWEMRRGWRDHSELDVSGYGAAIGVDLGVSRLTEVEYEWLPGTEVQSYLEAEWVRLKRMRPFVFGSYIDSEVSEYPFDVRLWRFDDPPAPTPMRSRRTGSQEIKWRTGTLSLTEWQ